MMGELRTSLKPALLLAALLLVTLGACTGSEQSAEPLPAGVELTDALAELAALDTPPEADADIFAQLKDALEEQLLAGGQQRFASIAPAQPIHDLSIVYNGDGSANFQWTYNNTGDYDLNGLVAMSDLTPLGQYFNTSALPDTFPPSSRYYWVDGDHNGNINISDLTPIGTNFNRSVVGYRLEACTSADLLNPDNWFTLAVLEFSLAQRTEDGGIYFCTKVLEPPTGAAFRVVTLSVGGEGPVGDSSGEPPVDALPPAPGSIAGRVTLPGAPPGLPVTVSVPGLEVVLSDSEGNFVVEGVTPAERVPVTFSIAGYAERTVIYQVLEGQQCTLDVELIARPMPVPFDPTLPTSIAQLNGVGLELPANSLVDAAGSALTAPTALSLTYYDSSDPAQLAMAPGDMRAQQLSGDTTELESFGMLEVFINDGTGQAANLASGQSAEVTIPIPLAQRETAEPTIGLYSFNTASGLWIEEATLTKNEAGTAYVGTVTHFSTWNADKPLETTYIEVTVLDSAGSPAANARVVAEGLDYAGNDSGWTDADGVAHLGVRIDSQVAISAEYPAASGTHTTPFVEITSPAEPSNYWDGDPSSMQVEVSGTELLRLPPTANVVRIGNSGPLPRLVTFDATGSLDPDGGSIVKYEWDSDAFDGISEFAEGDAGGLFEQTFSAGGEYLLSLRITDDEGQTRTEQVYLYVAPETASFNPCE